MDGRDWLTLTIYLVQALLVVSMAVVVLRENRQPVKTMAWLLVLSFIPVVGIVLFIFFGKDVSYYWMWVMETIIYKVIIAR